MEGFGGSFGVGSHPIFKIWVKVYHCAELHTGLTMYTILL